MSDLIIYTSDDGQTRINLRVEADSIWLSQLEIAELFQTTKQNVSLHAKNIFSEGELSPESVVKDSLTTAADGKNYRTQLYHLEKRVERHTKRTAAAAKPAKKTMEGRAK
jgi:hypothetical protein